MNVVWLSRGIHDGVLMAIEGEGWSEARSCRRRWRRRQLQSVTWMKEADPTAAPNTPINRPGDDFLKKRHQKLRRNPLSFRESPLSKINVEARF